MLPMIRRAISMLTFAEFVSAPGPVVAAFRLGYRLGRDKHNDSTKK